MIKTYFALTKPGIIFGNVVTATSGFTLAAQGRFHFPCFVAAFTGLLGVVASACVFNNYIDRYTDEKMERTKNRPLPQHLISDKRALLFGALLSIIGFATLLLWTNLLTFAIALIGFILYVAVYSISKYYTRYATLIGSVAGSMPPLIGYCAVTNTCDLQGILLFLVVALWQMPHFFSIALYRLDDYTAAALPVLPVSKGIRITKIHICVYILIFTCTALLLSFLHYTGALTLMVTLLLGSIWLWQGIKGFTCRNDRQWARQMFFLSLLVIMGFTLSVSLDTSFWSLSNLAQRGENTYEMSAL